MGFHIARVLGERSASVAIAACDPDRGARAARALGEGTRFIAADYRSGCRLLPARARCQSPRSYFLTAFLAPARVPRRVRGAQPGQGSQGSLGRARADRGARTRPGERDSVRGFAREWDGEVSLLINNAGVVLVADIPLARPGAQHATHAP
jgi:hypothetical protein